MVAARRDAGDRPEPKVAFNLLRTAILEKKRGAYRERPGVRLRVAAPVAVLRDERAVAFAVALGVFWRATGSVDGVSEVQGRNIALRAPTNTSTPAFNAWPWVRSGTRRSSWA